MRILLALLCVTLVACSGANSNPITVSLSGKVQYQDRLYDKNGFNGVNQKPVRQAPVQLLDGNVVIAKTVSDDDGNYALQGTGVNLRVRVVAETMLSRGGYISVNNYTGDTYAVTKSVPYEGEYHLDIALSVDQSVSGAFNILDVLSNGKRFISQYDAKLNLPLRAFWQPGRSDYGTYYCSANTSRSSCPGGSGIYLVGGNGGGGDTDQFDDDVILHEFGHYIEDQLHIQDSPGGSHYLSDNDSDIRLSWSEGWGGFMPGAVKGWLASQSLQLLSSVPELPRSYFVDTYANFSMISMDLGDPDSYFCWTGNNCYAYSSSEVAVANVLNGLNQAYGFSAIWNSVSGYLPSSTPYAASLETFWDGWVSQRSPAATEMQNLQAIFNKSQVFYQPDNYESDNNYLSAQSYSICANCAEGGRYLYNASGNDIDYVHVSMFAGKTYLVETFDLANAADTYIRILQADGSQAYSVNGAIMANDNRPGTVFCSPLEYPCRIHNDDKTLSSELRFSPSYSGEYVIEIATSTKRPVSAGRYGSYSLSVQELP